MFLLLQHSRAEFAYDSYLRKQNNQAKLNDQAKKNNYDGGSEDAGSTSRDEPFITTKSEDWYGIHNDGREKDLEFGGTGSEVVEQDHESEFAAGSEDVTGSEDTGYTGGYEPDNPAFWVVHPYGKDGAPAGFYARKDLTESMADYKKRTDSEVDEQDKKKNNVTGSEESDDASNSDTATKSQDKYNDSNYDKETDSEAVEQDHESEFAPRLEDTDGASANADENEGKNYDSPNEQDNDRKISPGYTWDGNYDPDHPDFWVAFPYGKAGIPSGFYAREDKTESVADYKIRTNGSRE